LECLQQKYCNACSEKILKEWQGWPHRDVLPFLPKMSNGNCEICGNANGLEPLRICWLNYHSEFSTGLPDYWLLVIKPQGNKWGYPYYGESNCPKCGGRSIVSQMKYPNGTSEICHNCEYCGVIKINKNG
jgi:hypothetical protein